MQEDIAISGKPYIPVNFLVVRVKSKRDRLWEVDKDDIVFVREDGAICARLLRRSSSGRSLVAWVAKWSLLPLMLALPCFLKG